MNTVMDKNGSGPEVWRQVQGILSEILCLDFELSKSTVLLGNLPELDSMAVVTIITTLEERFGIVVDDDDDLSEAFQTLSSLSGYVETKLYNV